MGVEEAGRRPGRCRHAALCQLALAAITICSRVAAQQPQYFFEGRFQPNQNGAKPHFTWASTTVKVPFTGDNVTVELARVPNTGTSQFELRVDGQLLESASTDSYQPKNVTIPSLGGGPHTLVITKITEALFGEALLTGIYLDPAGSFTARQSAVPARRMEIIGASVMNGYGDLSASMGCSDLFMAEDSVLAVGPLVANHLGARFAQIAWSGAGIITPGAARPQSAATDAAPPTIPELYARALPADPTSQWNAASFVPQVVLLEAGGNDFREGVDLSNWQAAYKSFLSKIRSNAPDAYLIVLRLPDNINAALGRPAAYVGNLTAAVADLQDGGFNNLALLQIPPSVVQDDGGCAGHPSADTHARMAEIVQSYVANVTGWSAASEQRSFLWRVDGGR